MAEHRIHGGCVHGPVGLQGLSGADQLCKGLPHPLPKNQASEQQALHRCGLSTAPALGQAPYFGGCPSGATLSPWFRAPTLALVATASVTPKGATPRTGPNGPETARNSPEEPRTGSGGAPPPPTRFVANRTRMVSLWTWGDLGGPCRLAVGWVVWPAVGAIGCQLGWLIISRVRLGSVVPPTEPQPTQLMCDWEYHPAPIF